jgi:hypothetical protein
VRKREQLKRRNFLLGGAALRIMTAARTEAKAMMHIAMIGDSVFDNASYVGDAPDVRGQLQSLLTDAKVTSSAGDGAVLADIPMQLRQIPHSATHIIVSIGGNDAIGASGVLEERAANVADALEKLAVIRDRFDRSYGNMIDLVLERRALGSSHGRGQ